MRVVLGRVANTLAAGSALLVLAACGSTAPTAPGAATATASQQPSFSGVVRGWIFDTSNRPVANANVECASNAQCTRFGDVSAQDGADQGVKTDANGYYELILTPSGGSSFLLNASARGYGIVWHQVALPDPSCTWSQAGCAVTLSFTLTPAP